MSERPTKKAMAELRDDVRAATREIAARDVVIRRHEREGATLEREVTSLRRDAEELRALVEEWQRYAAKVQLLSSTAAELPDLAPRICSEVAGLVLPWDMADKAAMGAWRQQPGDVLHARLGDMLGGGMRAATLEADAVVASPRGRLRKASKGETILFRQEPGAATSERVAGEVVWVKCLGYGGYETYAGRVR